MLGLREPAAWEWVTALIAWMQAKAYDEAGALPTERRDLAGYRGERDRFAARIGALRAGYADRRGLLDRLRKAVLIG